MANISVALKAEIQKQAFEAIKFGIEPTIIKRKKPCRYCGVITNKDRCPACGAWRKEG